MPEICRLANAPITEALFDIRVKANSKFEPSEFSILKTKLKDQYPEVQETFSKSFQFKIEPRDDVKTEVKHHGIHGYLFKSEEEKQIVQYRIDGFTLNKLKPYTNWKSLLPQVIEYWNLYNEIAKPEAITRIAVRYINHIPIHLDHVNFDDYLSFAPKVPDNLPQSISNFFYRVTILDENHRIAAHVIQTYKRLPNSQGIQIILDIDAHKNIQEEYNNEQIISTFDQLREFKNMIFFNYITDKTKDLFK